MPVRKSIHKKRSAHTSANGLLVPSLARAFQILDTLTRSSIGLSKSELSRKLKIPYSSTFNLLVTMEHFGYVRKDESSGKYYLGPQLFSFASVQPPDTDLRSVASPVLEDLVRRTECTVHLAILDRGEAIYIDKKEPNRYFKVNSWVGKRNYPHTSAVGKALMAYRPLEEVREVWKRGLPKRTAKTVSTLRDFQRVLTETRRRGYAIDDEEEEVGGRCAAAPIWGPDGSVIAVVGVSGHVSYFPSEKFPVFGEAVRAAAAEISRRLGHRIQ
jgi:DNA-binding IclR family transcriptional regulator